MGYLASIMLFDGPPGIVIPDGVATVCCTSATEPCYQRMVTRGVKSATLCMPLWSREELVHAMDAKDDPEALHSSAIDQWPEGHATRRGLGRDQSAGSDDLLLHKELLTLGHRAINERFDVFGGVADLCLNGDPNGFYQRRMAAMITDAFDTRDLHQLLVSPLDGKQDDQACFIRQRLIHRVPARTATSTTATDNSSSGTSSSTGACQENPEEICLASCFAAQTLHDRMWLLQDERESLLRRLHPRLSDFVWTSRTHSRLIQGGTFKWRTVRPLSFHELDWVSARLPSNTQLTAGEPDDPLQPHCYHPCPASFMSSVDGYCLQPDVAIVTITGSPGIGKSMFYAYCWHHFHGFCSTITTTAFSSLSTPLGSVKWVVKRECPKQEGPVEKRQRTEGAFMDHVVHLCDGTPDRVPFGGKAVCFTSLDDTWLRDAEKGECHAILYLPPWSEDELVDAAAQLGGIVDEKTVRERFRILGGNARACLASGASRAFEQHKTRLCREIKSIGDLQLLRAHLLSVESGACEHHLMCQYFPKHDGSQYDLIPASKYVRDAIADKVHQVTKEKREQIMEWIHGIPQSSALYGFLFESVAHDRLCKKGTSRILELQNSRAATAAVGEDLTFEDSNRLERYPTAQANLNNDSSLPEGPYLIPDAWNFPSIDSFYIERDAEDRQQIKWIAMFQMTTAAYHPIKTSGILFVLNKLGVLDLFYREHLRLKLVFVVPSDSTLNTRQTIVSNSAKGESEVSQLIGVTPDEIDELKKQNVETIQDLQKRCNENGLPKLTRRLTIHEGMWLKHARQFRLQIPVPDPRTTHQAVVGDPEI